MEYKCAWIKSKIKGTLVSWPAVLIGMCGVEFCIVYIKSDNAELKVENVNVSPFTGEEKLATDTREILKKKKLFSTLKNFEEDLCWVQNTYELGDDEKLNQSETILQADRAITESVMETGKEDALLQSSGEESDIASSDEDYVPPSSESDSESNFLTKEFQCLQTIPGMENVIINRDEFDVNTGDSSEDLSDNEKDSKLGNTMIGMESDVDRELLDDFLEESSDDELSNNIELDESLIVRDVTVPGIYMRKVLKCSVTKSGQAKKKTGLRVYNSYNSCFVCDRLVQHIPAHMKTHRNVKEVRKLLVRAKPDWSELRMKGNDLHNQKVISAAKGEIILSRRPANNVLSVADYGPCPECRDWVNFHSIKYHYRRCIKKRLNRSNTTFSNRDLIVQSKMLAGHITAEASKMMIEEVFPTMSDDEIGIIAKQDPLIIGHGEIVLRQNISNKEKRRYYVSQRMRLCARLLIQLREIASKDEDNFTELSDRNDLWSFLTPNNFDYIVKAALRCCMQDMDDEEELQSPSNAIKLKYDLRQLSITKWAKSVKSDESDSNQKEIQDSKRVLKLINTQWKGSVNSLARSVLQSRRWEVKSKLPLPEDVRKLSDYLITTLQNTERTKDNYMLHVKLCQARLLYFNRRRSGELEVIKLHSYASRSNALNDIDQSLLSTECTKLEKMLLKTYDLMTVRGKNSKPVPVLIPEDCKKTLKFLASHENRLKAGVKPENPYLFPNSAKTFARAYSSLKFACSQCDLQSPTHITSVNMRKYTATLTQMMNLNRNELDYVCKHLSHTKDIHETYYQEMSGFIERVNISKLLLIQDNNLTNKYKGCRLDEIDITDLIVDCAETNVAETNVAETNVAEETTNALSEPAVSEEPADDPFTFEPDLDDMEEIKKKKNTHSRQRWTKVEEEELRKYFKDCFESKTTPHRRQIDSAKIQSRKNNGELYKRQSHLIIKKISAINHK